MDALANNFQVLFQGLALGSIYALVALGFVLIIRATNVVNFAQGDFAMLGAYMMVAFLVGVGLPYWLSFVLALVGMGVFGLIFNYGVYYPLRHRGFLPVIISTLGASIFLQNTVLALFGAQPKRLDNVIAGGIQIGSVFLDSQYLVILAGPWSWSHSSSSSSSTPCSARNCRRRRRIRTWRACSASRWR